MDTERPNGYQELMNLQLKIASLFKDLLRERSSYKQNYENLSKNIERLSSETENIKQENRLLKQINEEMRNVIYKGVHIFENMDFSSLNLKKESRIEFENLKKHFVDIYKNLGMHEWHEGENKKEFYLEHRGLTFRPDIKRCEMKESIVVKDFNSRAQSLQADADSKKTVVMDLNKSELVLNDLFDRKPQNVKEEEMKKHPLLVLETEPFDMENINANICKLEESPAVESFLCRSPVFKDFGVRKLEDLTAVGHDLSKTESSSSVHQVDDKLVEKSKSLIISPWKKFDSISGSSPTKGPSTPKRTRKKLKLTSPKGSPKAHLKKSNSREIEISTSGVRKLTQTLLNIECYKRKSPEKEKNCESEDFGNVNDVIKQETEKIIDPDEDDFIIESPMKSEHILEDIKNKIKTGNGLNDIHLITPPETSDADLDETFVSASLVKRCEVTQKRVLERIIEDQTPLKRPARQKSPEYDSVPFVYKREPVRKKAERMKLPGHACLECNKYYENALGDIDSQDLKKILNKCSRHRDKYSPSHDETLPGYWKPYLTCSVKVSPEKGDT